jgi:hypothetical protein
MESAGEEMSNGKGDARRPENAKANRDNWELVFRKQKKDIHFADTRLNGSPLRDGKKTTKDSERDGR